jgi:hypothetical protein
MDKYENSSRSRCPYPTLGAHFSIFPILLPFIFPWRCSSRSMQMKRKKCLSIKENIESASTMVAHDKEKEKASGQSTG